MQHSRFPVTVVSLTVALLAATFSAVAAQDDNFTPNFSPSLQISKTAGEIEIDGDLSDPGWQSAVRTGGFSEVGPGDNTQPAVRSEALMTYDEGHLYVALIAYDNPAEIRVSMSDRDNIFRDDYFGVMLDTYADYSWGYELFVNPLGIQGDLRLLSNGGEDISLDIVYESRGIVTDSGYQVEMAIPFASLRFPDQPEQTWRLNFWRDRQRDNRYQYAWTAQDRDNSCWFCQWGTLTGIRDIKPGTNLDILPNIVAYQSGGMTNAGDPHSRYDGENPDAELSLNARYGLSTNSSLEVTINPDFSQVESDAGQIDVNETFALYYNERRPFFQEGSDLYQTFANIVYTRAINDPLAAAKFTGQWGRFSMSYLSARDDNTPLTIPLREASFTIGLEESFTNIVRGRRTFGQDSYVGFFLTDRRTDGAARIDTLSNTVKDSIESIDPLESDTSWYTTDYRVIDTVNYSAGSGTVLAVDSRIRLDSNYRLQLMALGSHISEPDGDNTIRTDDLFDYGQKTVALDGESYNGHGLVLGLNRGGRTWSFNLNYSEFSPTFRPDNGLLQGNDRRNISFSTNLTFRPNKEWLIEWGPNMSLMRMLNHRARFTVNPNTFGDGIRDEAFNFGLRAQLKGQTQVNVSFMVSQETFKGTPQTGISRIFVNFDTRPSGAVDFGANFEYGKKVIRYLDAEDMRMGLLTNLTVYGGLKLSERLKIYPTVRYQRMNERDQYMRDHPDAERTQYEQVIIRTRINYQFTREWFLRLIVEHRDFNHASSPNRLFVEPLLTYRINPFTKFYVGAGWGGRHFNDGYEFSRSVVNSDNSIDWNDYTHDNSTWRLNRAQVFAKLQYLFRI